MEKDLLDTVEHILDFKKEAQKDDDKNTHIRLFIREKKWSNSQDYTDKYLTNCRLRQAEKCIIDLN